MKLLTTLVTVLICSSSVLAGGYQVNLQSSRGLGMGHVGTGLVIGPSSAFFNPGALSFLDSSGLDLGVSFVLGSVAYQGIQPSSYGTYALPGVGTPFYTYFNYKNSDWERLGFGLSVNTPFGSSIAYEDDWVGKAVVQKMSLRAVFIQPTISFRLTNRLGFGAGVVFGSGNFLLEKAVPVQNLSEEYGKGTLKGSATGWGYNMGLFYQAMDELSFGLSYRSGVSVSTDQGEASFVVPSSLSSYFPTTSFSTTLKMPSVLNFGLGYQLNDDLTFGLDVNAVGWSVYDSLQFDFAENTDKLDDISSARSYSNSLIVRVGGEYKLNDSFTVRAGAYMDNSPVQDGYITPETPDSDKLGLTAGCSLTAGGFEFDFAYLYLDGAQRTDVNIETGFGGTWKTRASVFGIGARYLF